MPHPLGRISSTITAVHLNHHRARQCGQTPSHPAYVLKQPSSLAGTGGPIVRAAAVSHEGSAT